MKVSKLSCHNIIPITNKKALLLSFVSSYSTLLNSYLLYCIQRMLSPFGVLVFQCHETTLEVLDS